MTFCDFLKCNSTPLRVTHPAPTFPQQSNFQWCGLFVCRLDWVAGAQVFSHGNTIVDGMKLTFKYMDSVPFRICENLVQPAEDLTRTEMLTVSQVRDAFHLMVSKPKPRAVPAFRSESNHCLFLGFDFRLAHTTRSCLCGLQTWKSFPLSVFLLISRPFLPFVPFYWFYSFEGP